MTTMTPEQISNFRKVLVGMIGPYALIMPDKDVVEARDMIQARINREEAAPTCPPPSEKGLGK